MRLMAGALSLASLLAASLPAAADDRPAMLAIEGAIGIGAVTHGRTFAAFEAVQHLHLGYRLPMGLQAGMTFHHAGAIAGDQDTAAELFLFGLEARYHPFAEACVDPWVGLVVGFGGLHEDGTSPWRREQWNGAALIPNIGVLFRVTRELALGGWVGTTLGLWKQECVLEDPYQIEHCLAHRDARVLAIGVSVAPRFWGR